MTAANEENDRAVAADDDARDAASRRSVVKALDALVDVSAIAALVALGLGNVGDALAPVLGGFVVSVALGKRAVEGAERVGRRYVSREPVEESGPTRGRARTDGGRSFTAQPRTCPECGEPVVSGECVECEFVVDDE